MGRTFIRTFVLAAFLVWGLSSATALNFRSTLNSIKVDGRPGQVVNRSFQMTLGPDEKRTHFKSRVEDWWRSEDGKQSFYREPGAPGTPSRSCAKWVKLNPVEAEIDPGETLNVRVTVSIPDDAKPGGYWCVLTVDEVPDPLSIEPEKIGMRFVASVSVGIFVYISPVERSARILDVQVVPGQATLKLRNDGNCPLGIEGRFEFVQPGQTEPVAVATIPRSTVLPEPINTGILLAQLPDDQKLPSGRYIVRAVLDIGLDHYIGVQREMEIDRGRASPTKE